jgi:hypothetical protein
VRRSRRTVLPDCAAADRRILSAACGLATLEEQIDDWRTRAKDIDREGLANALVLLRRAGNEVVWKLGQ